MIFFIFPTRNVAADYLANITLEDDAKIILKYIIITNITIGIFMGAVMEKHLRSKEVANQRVNLKLLYLLTPYVSSPDVQL